MIEIAISLAVIGFALVAIIGVLPYGMNVQKENREGTIINQDATVLMNAIRNGARGMDDLVNYVIAITNYSARCDYTGKPLQRAVDWYTPNNSSFGPGFALTNGSHIIGLLSTPKYLPVDSRTFVSNYVVAAFRSLSGPVSEKFPQNNADVQALGLSYRMISEVVPYGTSYYLGWGNPMPPNLQNNLHEVRLNFRWPLAQGTNAPGRQVFRAMVGGQLTNDPPYGPFYFFEPQTYLQVNSP
jgi:type II secretory pathway pseudopilin PulG